MKISVKMGTFVGTIEVVIVILVIVVATRAETEPIKTRFKTCYMYYLLSFTAVKCVNEQQFSGLFFFYSSFKAIRFLHSSDSMMLP